MALAALQFLIGLWLKGRFNAALRRQTDAILEKLRWDYKVREQAARVAEYMALARQLREDSDAKDYQAANRLAWELAMWLPPEVYRATGKALSEPNEENNPLTVAIAVRKVLLGAAAGDLGPSDVIHHAPRIGGPR